jgi:hypothetical protein
MMNGKRHALADNLKIAFESGYSNAATSLSKMANDKIEFNNFHHNFHRLDSDFFNKQVSFSRNGGNHLITTEIFGDVTGKSYLFLSDKEFEALTSGMSNKLKLKMYGDIPLLVGKVLGKIEDIIFDDFNDQTEEVYINSIFFSFEAQPIVTPFFVWVVDSQVQHVLESKLVI